MKGISFILITTLCATVLHAQNVNFSWAKQMSENGPYGTGTSIVLDASGNIYVTGSFSGTVDFDPGPGVFNLSTANSSTSVFISKLDAAGNFIWAKQMGKKGYGYANAITLDASGNIYIAGQFNGTIDFDPGPGTYDLSSFGNNYEYDIFVSKLDASGNFVWAKQMGGINSDVANSIAVDAAGDVYTTGTFTGSGDFDPGPEVFDLTGSLFVSKLDAAGNFVWAKEMGGTLAADIIGQSIALDASGNIYVSGIFSGTVDFDPGTGDYDLNTPAGSGYNSFISKLDGLGNFIWAKQMSRDFTPTATNASNLTLIRLDASGNLYATGNFTGTVDFDPGPEVFDLTTKGQTDSYILKLDAAGNFVWVKQIGGAGNDAATAITTDDSGNIYTAGYFQGTADFDPGPGVFNLTASNQDIYLSEIDPSGNFILAKKLGGSGNPFVSAITLDSAANVYSVGQFAGTVDFNPGNSTYNMSSSQYTSIFVQRMNQCKKSTYSIINASTCSSYTLNGQVYDSGGVYTQILENISGCDSIITLNLAIKRANTIINETACESYTLNNHTYNISGIYSDTLFTTNGCDSIITLFLTIGHHSFSTITQTICKGQIFEGHKTGGIYIDTFSIVNGCDSIRVLQLTVTSSPAPDLGADKNLCPGDSLILYPGQFDNYLWQDNSTQSHYIVKQGGLYSVNVGNQCGSAQAEINIPETSCYFYFPSAFTPNNDGKNDVFGILTTFALTDYTLSIYNRWGEKIFETKDYKKGWDGYVNGQLQETGTYIWLCKFKKSNTTENMVLKGSVLLIH